jgi:hypothetical protein
VGEHDGLDAVAEVELALLASTASLAAPAVDGDPAPRASAPDTVRIVAATVLWTATTARLDRPLRS